MSQRRAKDIEEKEEARRHKKASQPVYDQRKQAAMAEDNRAGPAEAVLNLQQSYGNRYVQRLMGKVQPKLIVNPPDDEYEREADRVADAVTHASASSVQRQVAGLEDEEPIQAKPEDYTRLQRQTEDEEEEEEEEEPIQTKKAVGQTPLISSSLQSRINSLKGGGQPLPESTRRYFEPRFGSSFNNIRIHNDSKAANIAKSINAKAFTTGKDIVFGTGQYSPETSGGKCLLAHELAHVVQQGAARVSRQTADMEGTAANPKEEAKKALKDDVDKLKTKLEIEYIKDLLRIAGNCQAQGMEESAYKWAIEEAAEAASTMLKRKTAGLDVKSAKKEMVTELLNTAADVMKLGGDDKAIESALKKALDWAKAQLASAMNKLKAAPIKANAKEVAAKAAQVELLGGDSTEAWGALKTWEEKSGEKEKLGEAK